MATEGKTLIEGSLWRANSNLSNSQFLAVKIVGFVDASDPIHGPAAKVDLADTGSEAIAGILMGTPLINDPADVAFIGFPRARAGAAGFTCGDKLVTEAGTACLTTFSGSGTVVAVAMATAGAGCLGAVRLIPTTG